MLIDTIQAELLRVQLHPENLSVSGKDKGMVELHGSLLQYWDLPHRLEGNWLLAQLQELKDAVGPETVMTALVSACSRISEIPPPNQSSTQLRLFDPQNNVPVK